MYFANLSSPGILLMECVKVEKFRESSLIRNFSWNKFHVFYCFSTNFRHFARIDFRTFKNSYFARIWYRDFSHSRKRIHARIYPRKIPVVKPFDLNLFKQNRIKISETMQTQSAMTRGLYLTLDLINFIFHIICCYLLLSLHRKLSGGRSVQQMYIINLSITEVVANFILIIR